MNRTKTVWFPLGLNVVLVVGLFLARGNAFGMALALAGLGGIFWARWSLGEEFSTNWNHVPRRLVREGLYGYLRNPIYLFSMVWFAGVLLMLRSPWMWLLWPLVGFVQWWRAVLEAEMLEAKFGAVYREYRRWTWL